MKKIPPITKEYFLDSLGPRNRTQVKYYSFFENKINSIKDHAIGLHIWIIFNLVERKVEIVSENVEQFTPFKKADWIHNMEDGFFINLFHPDDRMYLLSAFQLAEEMRLQLDNSRKGTVKFNFYGRMMDMNHEYRLVMIKSIGEYINTQNDVEASLTAVFDISHYKIPNLPLLSVIDYSKEETQYYKYIERDIKNVDIEVPKIAKREKEILNLMCEGYNTPQIAFELSISYHTVENHKRNLRKKTNTKTSSELIAFVMIHNLI
ncbi:helix-turn-helix transcriptional regulator [Chryseobacterium sp.]|uniref:helix-turn-helix transcriptional regulator n=1 Tax=Chryseobacterium sp. TaxID=1871047 RepID=UPI000EC4CFA6|nr:helix-turn-helix transcriptional regulator [Chryseobacterium sp.]HCA06939.1 helix-turn-helix transcriptional regulator [Chryseobacterium sp.]